MKTKLVIALSALLIAGACIAAALFIPKAKLKSEAATETYDVVFFGDSIVAGDYTEWSLAAWVGKNTGLKVLNAAFGGCTMCLNNTEKLTGDASELYSMYRLSEALSERDFSLQIMASQKENLTVLDGIYEASVSLQHTDWESVRYILIEHGVNDYLNGAPIENPDDPYDAHTYAGALRTVIENVQAAVPNARLILLTPIYAYPDSLEKDCTEADYGGGLLTDYIAAEKEIASAYGIYLIDDYTETGINRSNYKDYLFDGLHGSEEGKEYIAPFIAAHLLSLEEENGDS